MAKDQEAILEERAQARDLLAHPGLKLALELLRETYIQQLMSEQPGTLTAATVHAKLLVVADIPNALENVKAQPLNRR